MSWTKLRDIVEVDYRWAEGVPLESLAGCKGYVCKALIHHDWKKMYFLTPRAMWELNDYFEYAKKRLSDIGIKEP